MHIDRGNDLTVQSQLHHERHQPGHVVEVFGESSTRPTGQPSAWMNTFTMLASQFPNMKFIVAEYQPAAPPNDIMWNLPANRGLGTFNWEPTTPGHRTPAVIYAHHSGSTYPTHSPTSRATRPDEGRLRLPPLHHR